MRRGNYFSILISSLYDSGPDLMKTEVFARMFVVYSLFVSGGQRADLQPMVLVKRSQNR